MEQQTLKMLSCLKEEELCWNLVLQIDSIEKLIHDEFVDEIGFR